MDKEIADLKARVAKYETELDSATTAQEKSEIRQLINSRTETLNRLLDEKKAQSGGKYISCSSMSLNVIGVSCCELI